MINKKVLKKVIESATGKTKLGAKITLYSKPANIILRYMDLTNPQFTRSGAAAELLEAEVKKEYPDIWKEIISNIPGGESTRISHFKAGAINIIPRIWKQAEEETNTRVSKIITVFHPRVSATLRYVAMSTPGYSISGKAGRLLERALEKKSPALWKQVLDVGKNHPKRGPIGKWGDNRGFWFHLNGNTEDNNEENLFHGTPGDLLEKLKDVRCS